MGKCGFFFPQHLWNTGKQTGSNQHRCPMLCRLQDCMPSQLTPNTPAWRSCWWSLHPPSPQKKTKTSRKEDKQEISWQTVQPQVAFNSGPKPLGNREVVTSIQVIFCFEETPTVSKPSPVKRRKNKSKRQSSRANMCVSGGTKQNNAAALFAQPHQQTWPFCGNVSPPLDDVAETMKLRQLWSQRETRGAFSSCFWQRPTPDAPHNQLMGESLRKQRAKKNRKKPWCFPFSLYRKTLARPISSFGIKCDSTVH